MRFTLENHSGYDTRDLARVFRVAFRALGVKRDKRVIIVASPIRTRGCATVANDRQGTPIVVAIAPPSKFSMARFARILEHEIAHARGSEHADMKNERLLYSEGPTPRWARGLSLRYRRRAPDQMKRLRPA